MVRDDLLSEPCVAGSLSPEQDRNAPAPGSRHCNFPASIDSMLPFYVRVAGRFSVADRDIRAALDQHWAASDANDFELEHQIYRDDAVLEYPQSGERIRGRRNIQITRTLQPSRKRFKVRRVIGAGDLWVTEYLILYDGQPSYTVSIMEFDGDKVARETQYFGDPFEASAWRSRWVEPIEKKPSPP
jgi:ketosteroid isomerase-like protein